MSRQPSKTVRELRAAIAEAHDLVRALRAGAPGTASPTDPAELAKRTVLRLRLTGYRSRLMRLAPETLEELVRRIIEANPDLAGVRAWLIERGEPGAKSAFYRFAKAARSCAADVLGGASIPVAGPGGGTEAAEAVQNHGRSMPDGRSVRT